MPGAREHGITMWGPPGSGKTTFLAALGIALARHAGDWNLAGGDPASTEMLVRLTRMLSAGDFPSATAGIHHLRWTLKGRPPPAPRRGWRRRRAPAGLPASIGLDLVDAAGGIYAGPGSRYGEVRGDLVGSLAASRGIVFLFDPIREFSMGDAFGHTFGVMAELASRMMDSPDRIGGRLPHYIAVCVTKFDEVKVLRTAETLDLLTADPADDYGFPRVADEDAEELFAALCDVSRSGDAELMINTLRKNFLPSRVRFFVTSSIGFHVSPVSGSFDPEDWRNLVPGTDGGVSVRGGVRPINVMEPVLWLAGKIAGA